jgi:two-component system OmpR family response regulator
VQLEARLARQLRVEAPVEVVQSQAFVQARLRVAALREPVSTPVKLVLQDRCERLDERLLVGLSLCRDLRSKSATPIIMLTAMGEETDRIVGLEMGADDYLPKPFNPRELLARIKAVMRRAAGLPPSDPAERGKVLRFAGWTFDLGRRHLESPMGEAVELSTGEFELLVAFVERPQRVLSRDQLLDLARGRAAAPFDRSIDVQVSRLRRKIETDPKAPQIITTVRGGGYVFTPAVERA